MENNTAIPDTTLSQTSTAINGCATSQNIVVDTTGGLETTGALETRYGCLGCRPACLQFLVGIRWFLLFTFLATFCHLLVDNGLVGATISTVERRFGLHSSQSAWIAASYEIAGAPAVLIIGYLGSSLRRPVWIGGGLIMLGIGFGVYSIPHFAAPPYRYSESGDFSNLCVQTTFNSWTNNSLPANDRYHNKCRLLRGFHPLKATTKPSLLPPLSPFFLFVLFHLPFPSLPFPPLPLEVGPPQIQLGGLGAL